MNQAFLARLASMVLLTVILAFSTAAIAETKSMEIENLEWNRGVLLPAYCEIPLDLGGPVASIQKVTLKVSGQPQEGSMVICKGGCDTFPCHQTLYSYFSDFRYINAWTPLEGPATGYSHEIVMQYSDCVPNCSQPCEAKAAEAENWAFLQEDGTTVLRMELHGDLDGCGASCFAENGIEHVTVMVEYEPMNGDQVAIWGSMKAVYR